MALTARTVKGDRADPRTHRGAGPTPAGLIVRAGRNPRRYG
ncbi:MAG TPA: hypothetical protein VFO77_01995 [Actinoplanes sp.]|nr:hypothetical protein [Actinoplanes sp.]